MDIAAEFRGPGSKHQIQSKLSMENRRGTGRLNPSRETKFSGTYGDRGMLIFPVQLTTTRIGNLTRAHTTACPSVKTTHSSRALSLRNLVSGYECGRVFPAGVGPGSPSRDAANWLPSRFSLSVETRRRYVWLRMVFPRARLGALRDGGGTREAGSTVAESLVVLYRVGTHQIRRRRRAARSSTSQGRAEPFSSYEGHKERRTGKIRGAFLRMHRALDGWMLARAPALPARGLYSLTIP